MKKILQGIIRQKREVSLVPGAVIQMWSGAQVYQGIVNSFLLIATAYNTTLRDAMHVYAPWLNFWLFFFLILAGNLIMMVLHFKYIQPSIQAFNATQGYKLINPAVDDLKEIRKTVKYIKEKLG